MSDSKPQNIVVPIGAGDGEIIDDDLIIVSWNVNGLRSLNMKEILSTRLGLKCSILGIQETKLTRSQLEESQALINNYTSYFSFSRNRAGYSGVATYCCKEITPIKAEDGIAGTNLDSGYKELSTVAVGCYIEIGEEEYADAKYGDSDGRAVITQHVVYEPDGTERLLNVINLYCPRLRDDPTDPINNRQFKYNFHNFVSQRARKMVQNNQFVIIMGDLNVSHQILDQSDVEDPKQFIHHEFRQWLDDLLSEDDDGVISFVDTFRMKYPSRAQSFTCWNTRLNARQNNYGSRIDYIIADSNLSLKYLKDADVHQSVMGSDHCPISATFHSLKLRNNAQISSFASKFYSEFSGKQQKLVDLFKKQESVIITPTDVPAIKQNEPRKRINKAPKQTSLTSFLIKKPRLEVEKTDVNSTIVAIQSNNSPSTGATEFFQQINSQASAAWKQILKTPEIPLCTGHNERCVQRTVTKKGQHRGRQFWACSRGTGKSGDPNSNCNFFKWSNSKS